MSSDKSEELEAYPTLGMSTAEVADARYPVSPHEGVDARYPALCAAAALGRAEEVKPT